MVLDTVIKQIISLFIVVLIGFYGRKRNIIDANLSNGLTNLLLQITLPLLVVSSFSGNYSSSMGSNIARAFIYGLAIYIITPLITKLLLIKIEKKKRNILQFALVFSNCGFMGFPLAESVFGQEGVIYTSIFNMFYNLFIWTYGVMIFTDIKDLKETKKVFKNPGIIAVFIGLFIMIFSIKIPVILLDTMKMVGGLTTPISMLIIGSLLATADFKKALKDMSIYYGSFIKLLLIPVILAAVAALFNEKSMVIKVFILLQAMPAGAMTSIFAENFNKEKEYSALIVSFSTLLSIITIPLIIKFFV
jgi:malate permease and related proteins